ncbi:hypothetical protein D1BOALGB6SA_1043 [Olavius sp. associated proteobacterium Delta 1]|nr:hypothetical protein D1BOALGB6SA_1043 [Olavius sp. associated proteobacterium Delta 1]
MPEDQINSQKTFIQKEQERINHPKWRFLAKHDPGTYEDVKNLAIPL